MGRSDAVKVVLDVCARARAIEPRLAVDFLPGWETRGNGLRANYQGGIVHHTTGRSSEANPLPSRRTLLDGRPDLAGPLCNFAGPWCTTDRPRLTVVAAFPANHAGASGGVSMGPLPVTTLFNPRVLGLEIDYPGLSPMTDGQLHAAQVWARAVADVLAGGDVECVRAHRETSITGKWDPGFARDKTIDMAAFRRGAQAVTAARPLVEDDDVNVFITDSQNSPWFLYDGYRRRFVHPGEQDLLLKLGLVKATRPIVISPAEMQRIPLA
jgi:hypothetical protein